MNENNYQDPVPAQYNYMKEKKPLSLYPQRTAPSRVEARHAQARKSPKPEMQSASDFSIASLYQPLESQTSSEKPTKGAKAGAATNQKSNREI